MDMCTGSRNQWIIKARILKMYSGSAKGAEKGDPNSNPWLHDGGDCLCYDVLMFLDTYAASLLGTCLLTCSKLTR